MSVYNALAALCVGKTLGLADEAIHEGLARCVVKGRVELVPISKNFTILLDYAHNEVSTESLLTTLRAYQPHRLVVVFGCGGNRSKLRRYGMGEICARMADFFILTEDNNRFEKVEDILADIRQGMEKGNPKAPYVEIPDRLDALHYAVDHAEPGDLIAVIGKGHETYRDRMGVNTFPGAGAAGRVCPADRAGINRKQKGCPRRAAFLFCFYRVLPVSS